MLYLWRGWTKKTLLCTRKSFNIETPQAKPLVCKWWPHVSSSWEKLCVKFPYFLGDLQHVKQVKLGYVGIGWDVIHLIASHVSCWPESCLYCRWKWKPASCTAFLIVTVFTFRHITDVLYSILQMTRNPETAIKHAHTHIAVHCVSIVGGVGKCFIGCLASQWE